MKKNVKHEPHSHAGSLLEEFILGGQDGLVNVLGLVLGVAVATQNPGIVLLAGLAGTFSESVSMAAVAYTSQVAARDFYKSERKKEEWEVQHMPEEEKKEIKEIFEKKGFKGKQLNDLVRIFSSNKKAWVDLMMDAELHLGEVGDRHPLKAGIIVGIASFIGSIIPLISFVVLPIQEAIMGSLILAILVLFGMGAVKGKLTIGPWYMAGLRMVIIGIAAALAGYAIGAWFGVGLVI